MYAGSTQNERNPIFERLQERFLEPGPQQLADREYEALRIGIERLHVGPPMFRDRLIGCHGPEAKTRS